MGTRYVGSLDAFKDKMAAQGYAGLRYMGQRVPNVNGPGIVTGKTNYTMNVKVPGTCHAVFKRNPGVRSKIISIDTSKAEKMPGVVGVFTGKSAEFRGKLNLGDEPLLPDTETTFSGQAVAVVVGETIEAAEDAVNAIDVKYEAMDAVTDVVQAASMTPPVVVHTPRLITPPFEAERPNVINCFYVRSGDVAKGFADADVIIENEFSTHNDPHGYITPISALAKPNGDGTYTLWTDVQNIHPVPWPTAAGAADLPLDKVITMGPEVCSGGYGGKNCGVPGVYATLLAKITQRPVRVIFDDNKLQHATRPFCYTKIKVGAKNDGKFTALEATYTVGTPFVRFTMTVMERAREAITCTYHWGHRDLYPVPNVMFTAYDTYTNLPSTMSYRGFGVIEGQHPHEASVNMLADKLGMDKFDIRIKNLTKNGEKSAQDEIIRSQGSEAMLLKVKEIMATWGPKPSVSAPWVVGRGISGGNKYSQGDMVHNLLFLKLRANGLVDIISDSMEIGQGMNTVSRQIVAEGLNVPIENVHKVEVNTAYSPWTSDSFSSSATVDFGGAAVTCCKNAKTELFATAATKLNAKPGDLETKDGKIYVKGAPDKAVTWGECMAPRPHMMVAGGLNDPVGAPNDYDGPGKNDYYTGKALGPYFRLIMHMNFLANACEIMVNKETGEVRVTKFIAGNDAIPVNPTTMEGQILAGLVHGIGQGMYEEPYHDKGAQLNKSFLDFKIPTILDFPKYDDISTAIVPEWGEYFGDNPRVDCPFGAKGVGEGVLCSSIPCLGDAIHDALGVYITHSPLATQEKILKALGKA